MGIEARVDQRAVLIGNKKLMLREKVQLSDLEERASTLAAEAKTEMAFIGYELCEPEEAFSSEHAV